MHNRHSASMSLSVYTMYRIRKNFRGGLNFMVFADDKDPRNFFIKKAKIHEIYYTIYL